MKQVPLGCGPLVSEMCLGTMMFGDRCDQAESDRILGVALDAGVNFVDTAAMYCDGGTERILGNILGARRKRLFLATKVHKGLDAASIVSSVDESLARLRTDHLDLYMVHWPKKGMRPAEIMEALSRVVAAGKTRYVGCCNYPAWLLAHSNAIAAVHGWPRLMCNQVPYNLVERGVEVEVLPQAMAEKIAITAYRPVVMGLLTGKYRAGQPLPEDVRGQKDSRIPAWLDRHGQSIERMIAFAERRGLTPTQVAIAWVRKSPAVACPIVGVSSVAQLQGSLAGFDFDLTDAEYGEVTRLFDTEVAEEAGGNFKPLRRELSLLG
jgi:aryl-alcohol dehydrogenase-like predicted oxidoreductase